MSRRKSSEENVRKLMKNGNCYALTLPIDIIRELGWRKRQKVVVKRRGQGVVISDWE